MDASNRFDEAQTEFFRLKGKLATGHISRDEFNARVDMLQLQDEGGRFWRMDRETGQWLVHDGTAWILAQPPVGGSARPTAVLETPVSGSSPHPPTARRLPARNLTLWIGGLGLALICLIAAAVLGLFTLSNNVQVARENTLVPPASLAPTPPRVTAPVSAPTVANATPTAALASSNVPGIGVSVVPAPTPAPPAARDYAALNASLAAKIAALNQAELKFIRDVRALSSNNRMPGLASPLFQKGTALTDQDIKDLAGKAMDVAILAEDLGKLSTKQDGGSTKATQAADPFYSIARTALSLVLDAQNVRQALQSGLIPGGQAVDTIAEYGLQLWNSAVTDGSTKGNPFSAQTKSSSEAPGALSPNAASQVQNQIKAGNSSVWIVQSASSNTKTINVSGATAPLKNPSDPQMLNSLTNAEGQADGNKAQQVAAAGLQRLGATTTPSNPSQPSQLQVTTNPVAVAGSDQIKAGNLPTFKSGTATAISKNSSGDDNSFMNAFGLNGDQPPTDQGQTIVQDTPALVNLTISNVVITGVDKRPTGGSFEADVNFKFTVNWSTTLAAPSFNLNCNSGVTKPASQSSGSLNLSGNGLLILYPGTLAVYCYAVSANGQMLGSTSINVLVGDAAGATERANRVETDSAILDARLTAEAQNTQNAQRTQAAATAVAQQTINALETEVAADKTREFQQTAAAFATQQAIPPPPPATPSRTPTFTPQVVDRLTHPGNVEAVSTHAVLQRGRLYRFTFSGRVNVINPPRSLTAGQLPDRVNGVVVPSSGIMVVEGSGSVATISCGHEVADPKDPGAYGIVVEDLGPS